MSNEEEVARLSLDIMPVCHGSSICNSDDVDHTDLALTNDARPRAVAKSQSTMGEQFKSNAGREDLEKIEDLVADMKQGFLQALEELSKIQYSDKALEEKLQEQKTDYNKQLGDIVEMILSLKTELGTPLRQIRTALEEHKQLKRQVETLLQENSMLVEELVRNGVVQEGHRIRCLSRHGSPVSRSTSLPDSALLTPSHGRSMSDRDSGVTCTNQNDSIYGERLPPEVGQITPMVHTFIDNLHSSGVEQLMNDVSMDDSDNSVTAAANKSIDLSRSLVDRCLVESNNDDDDVDNDVDDRLSRDERSRRTVETTNGYNGTGPELHHRHKGRFCDRDNQLDRRKSAPSNSCTSLLASPFSRKTAPHELAHRDKQRSRVAHELVETERKYCSCLWTMVDFLNESLKTAAVINIRDVKMVFPVALSSMYDFHADILKRFEERINNWKLHAIVGDIFARMTDPNSDFLLLYQTYVNDFQTSLQTIRKCSKQSHKFRKLLMTLQNHPVCDGLDLTAYLLTPIQRIPRYVLLIKQMLTWTEADHPDHYYLETTLEKLKMFLDQLNNSIETGVPMHQYSYLPDRRGSNSSGGRYCSPYGTESETGSDVTSQSLDGDSSIISMSARKFATLKRSWGRLSQSLTNSRSKLQPLRSTMPSDSVSKPIPRTKLFQQGQYGGQASNVTLPPRRRRQRSRTADRPKSLNGRLDCTIPEYESSLDRLRQESIVEASFQRYGDSKRSKSQTDILEPSPRSRDSLSRSLLESDLIEKLVSNKVNHRSMPSVARVDENEIPAQTAGIWRETGGNTEIRLKAPKKSTAQSEGARRRKGGLLRDSIKSIFSRKRLNMTVAIAGRGQDT